MTAGETVLRRLRERGIEIVADGNRILCRPPGALSPAERQALGRNKGAILAALYQERFEAGVLAAMKPSDPLIQNLEAEVAEKGFVLIWSFVLEDLIAFCRSPEDAERVPRGLVCYTVDELAILFPESIAGISEGGLRLIHRAKQLGGGSVESTRDDDQTHTGTGDHT